MRRIVKATLLLGFAAVLALPAAVQAGDGPPGMTWVEDLEAAFALAREQDKPIMICINAKRVDSGRREPAAKELRQKTYRNEDVIELSKKFVCAYLTSEGSSNDFGELRLRYGIDGDIVSPQHIFAFPNGRLILRKEYWPYGYGQKAVDALLKLMNDALARDASRRGEAPDSGTDTPGGEATPGESADTDDVTGDDGPQIPSCPADAEGRATWIEEQMAKLARPDQALRRAAARALVDADKEGDIVSRLVEHLGTLDKQPTIQVDIIRALGRPGLEVAAEGLAPYLSAKKAAVRANTAVSLEYIGSKTSIAPLTKRAPREKDDAIANHMYRALGRCGAGEDKVRKFLLKKAAQAKEDLPSYGPILGLAYFENNAKAAKGVVKLIDDAGIPGVQGWRSALRRTLLAWCLSEVGVGDEKSVEYLREEVIPVIPKGRWTGRIINYYRAVAAVCSGDPNRKDDIDSGVKRAIGRDNNEGINPLMDDARRERTGTAFEPKGEWQAGTSG